MTINRKEAPKYVTPLNFNFELQHIEKVCLKNNVPLYYLTNNKIEVLSIDFIFKIGSYNENKKLVARLSNSLLKSGTRQKSAEKIAKIFETFGAYIEQNSGLEYSSISIKILSKYFENILPTIREILTEAIFPENELDIIKQRAIAHLQIMQQKVNYVADEKIDKLLFGENHSYAQSPTIKDYQNVCTEDLKHFYNKNYLNTSCQIFAVGNISSYFIELLNKYFGDLTWNQQTEPQNQTDIINTTKTKLNEVIINQQSIQTAVKIATIFEGRKHPHYFKVKFLNIVLGGYFGSRLMKNIREKKGYTYGIHSHIQNNSKECGWIITTECANKYSLLVINETYKEFNKLKSKPISNEELEQVKNFYLGLILSNIDNTFSSIELWKSLILKNNNEHFFYENIKTIKNISTQDIMEMANIYLNKKNFIELIVK